MNVKHIEKQLKPALFMLVFLSLFCLKGRAQISAYTFATGSGASLESMSSGTTSLISSGQDDAASSVTNIGFTFTYNGTAYTQFSANSNGLMRLGSTVVSDQWVNTLADANENPKIAPRWDDLSTASDGKVHYKLFGSAPNRYLVVEWRAYSTASTASSYNSTFQVVLTETTNEVKFIYGTCPATSDYSIGITTSSSDYIRVNGSTHASATTSTSDAQTAAMTSGRYYTFNPAAAMAFSSCTTTQSVTSAVAPGGTSQQMIGIEIVTTGSTSAITASSFTFNTTGSSAVADISNAKLWSTGTSSTFATSTQLGSTTTSPSGSFTITGGTNMPLTLSTGTNYFWLTYDIASTATLSDVVDAQCTSVTVGSAQTPTTQAPAGSRTITLTYCASNATTTTDEEILNVTFGTLNNTSTCGTTGGSGSTAYEYSDYTATVSAPSLSQSSSYSFSVQVGTCGGNYGNSVRIYIDYNRDGDFTDSGEDVYASSTTTTGAHTETGSISIPAGATLGSTRMRVINAEASTGSYSSCGTYSWGETEDYLVTIAGPAAMAYSSSTVVQSSTSTLSQCSFDQDVICVQVVTTGATSPVSLTQFQLGIGGGTTTMVGHVSKIHIYYTGTTNTFSATGEFVSGGTTPTGNTNTITGSQALSTGTNYFWVAYDIYQSSTVSDVVDASCTQITVAGSTQTPTATSPAGTRTITTCVAGPGGITSGLALWLRPGAGLTTSSGNVTAWADQSAAATAVTVNGSPDYVSSGYNNNPYISFTKSSATGGDYLSISSQDFQSLFWVAKLNDLTRINSHLATWDQVTFGTTANGCLHGTVTSSAAAYFESGYDNGFSGAGVWRKNGTATGITYATPHSGNFDIVSALGTNGTTTNRILGGQANTGGFDGRARDWYGPVGDIIFYTGSITTAQANKIESYLAIKYGITLGANASTTLAYTSPAGATVWTSNTGYHYDVTGIAKDNVVESLDQTKSQSINSGSTMPFTIAHSSISSPTSLSATNVYIMVGHNNGSVTSNTSVSYTHGGAAIKFQLARVWRIQTTNLPGGRATDELEIQFDMSNVPGNGSTGLGAANAAADLRLILDDNTTFGQGTANESIYSYSSTSSNLINFRIPFSALPATGTYFFTIGTTNMTTAPLPVDLSEQDIHCEDNKVKLNWTTVSETQNDFFTVQRSADGTNFNSLATIIGAGNSNSTIHYSWEDASPLPGTSYYRLEQNDFNGKQNQFPTLAIENCKSSFNLNIYPNPFENTYNISISTGHSDVDFKSRLMDVLGKQVTLPYTTKLLSNGEYTLRFDLSGQPKGIYLLQLNINGESSVTRLVKLID